MFSCNFATHVLIALCYQTSYLQRSISYLDCSQQYSIYSRPAMMSTPISEHLRHYPLTQVTLACIDAAFVQYHQQCRVFPSEPKAA